MDWQGLLARGHGLVCVTLVADKKTPHIMDGYSDESFQRAELNWEPERRNI